MATTHTTAPTAGGLRRSPAVSGAILTSKATVIRFAALAILLGAIWLGLMPLRAVPEVVPAAAPATQFSAERAMADVRALAARPRPIGSSAQAAARDYLVSQISALGLTPEVQQATAVRSGQTAAIAAVENVLVRLPGRESGRAVLITGHYDSVPTGPGAYDCANCAATVLETLRAIKASPQLKNDVVFLFTDGEEVETMGAQAFAEQHPWAKDVALAIVYEGYGSTGADILYGTGRKGGMGQRPGARDRRPRHRHDRLFVHQRHHGALRRQFVRSGGVRSRRHSGAGFHSALTGQRGRISFVGRQRGQL